MPLNESVMRQQQQLQLQQQQPSLRDQVEGAGDVFVDRKVLRLATVSTPCFAIQRYTQLTPRIASLACS